MKFLFKMNKKDFGIIHTQSHWIKFQWKNGNLKYIRPGGYHQNIPAKTFNKACRTAAWCFEKIKDLDYNFPGVKISLSLEEHTFRVLKGVKNWDFVPDKGYKVHYVGNSSHREDTGEETWKLITKSVGAAVNSFYPPRKKKAKDRR